MIVVAILTLVLIGILCMQLAIYIGTNIFKFHIILDFIDELYHNIFHKKKTKSL